MSTNLDCYSTIIGLSRTECACYDDEKPAGYDDTDSGLYLDEVEGLHIEVAKNAGDCAKGGLWDLMDNSRENAIKSFRSDTMNYIGRMAVKARLPYSGVIGDDDWSRNKAISNTYAGCKWILPPVRSGVMRLKRIGLVFDTAASFDVILYDNLSNTPLYTWNVTSAVATKPGQPEWFTIPSGGVLLPMYNTDSKFMRYTLIFITATSPTPKDTTVNCGCGNLKSFNLWSDTSPTFRMPEGRSNFGWMQWMIFKGTRGDLLTERETSWQTTDDTHGILLDATFSCKSEDILCKDVLDYDNDELSMVYAYAIRYKAAELLLESVLASPNLNRYTMLDRERLWGKRNHYRKEYDDRIEYIGDQLISAERINLVSDCFTCRNEHGFKKVLIRK